ncbi:ankyrin repeat-containing domain protein [Fusarium sporotrichioides]|uniref:Ankyrin repeat-containing domain protein n=1 Tax=Fusarium sporotrichioides TaxID=5514 RepID=A0A395RGK2_FUSSP|nr:ankyrin repeat-containing domain protein [Fusarium sporotrichioides]
MMPQSLDTIPNELLDSILDQLCIGDVINLWKANNDMSHRMSSRLFGNPSALNRVMIWACKHGDGDVVRTAISHGAHPSHILVSPRDKHSPPLPKPSNNQPPVKEFYASTLYMVVLRDHGDALDVLLENGAEFKSLGPKEKKKLIDHFLQKKRWDTLRKLIKAGLVSWTVDNLDISRCFITYIRAGTPIDILRSMAQGQNLDVVMQSEPNEAISPLSVAIDLGRDDVVDMLLKEGASIHGYIDCSSPSGKGSERRDETYYHRPHHIPIFAAARYMAHINQRAPALLCHSILGHHFTTSPLLTYVEDIAGFPVETELDPLAAIRYLMSYGADIQPREPENTEKWWCCVPRTWFSFQADELCQPLSIIEILLEQSSGVERADSIVLNFSFDSVVTLRPLPHDDENHPDTVPMWWSIVQQLWDKLDKVHGHNYAWIEHSLRLGQEVKDLIATGLEAQSQKDKLLYLSFIERRCLFYSQHYATLDRLSLERQVRLGADINAFAGPNGETILFHVCDQINNAFVKAETEAIDDYYRYPEMEPIFKTKLRELVLSLINMGADPRMPVDDLTSYHVLKRDINKAKQRHREYLVDLTLEIEEARHGFLENESTPSLFTERADILDLAMECRDGVQLYSPGEISVWMD